jgi:hypothetical protein
MPSPSQLPSDRSFGITFTIVFALVALWLLTTARSGAIAVAALGAATLIVSMLRPALLRPLNRVWMRIGELLHHVVSPVVLGGIYYVVIAPVAVAMRLKGRDALKMRLDRAARSYWVEREPPGPEPGSLPRQF